MILSAVQWATGALSGLNESASEFIRGYQDRERSKWALLIPGLVLIMLFLLIPSLLLLRYSFYPYIEGSARIGWSVTNYVRAILTPLYQTYLFRSLQISFATTLLTFVLGFPLAYTAARRGGLLGTLIVMVTLAPLTIDLVIRTFGWYVILSRGGLLQSLLIATPFFTEETAPSFLFSRTGVIIGMTHVLLPYMVFPIISIIHTIPRSLEEVAQDLGANRFEVFLRVILPLSLPGISAGVLIVFLSAMTSYVTPQILGGDYKVLATEITRLITASNNWPFASALSTLLIVISLVVIMLYYRTQLLIKDAGGDDQ
jgi:ABC-type spermidine/putrescine transport system permease subunit I